MIFLVLISIGLILGLRLRVAPVVAASAAITLACLVLLPFGDWSLMGGLSFAFGLLCALQSGYLLGSVVGVGLSGKFALLRRDHRPGSSKPSAAYSAASTNGNNAVVPFRRSWTTLAN